MRTLPNIFLVEEHPAVRCGLTQLLQRNGFAVCGELGVREEVSFCAESVCRAKPDLVVVDLLFDEMDGTRLIHLLRKQQQALPVLVFTMQESPLHVGRALRAGARGYVTKQDDPSELVAGVEALLAGEMYFSQRIRSALPELPGSPKTNSSPNQRLSNRELEVYGLLGGGCSTSEIARQLELSPKTVETYVARIKAKLHIQTARQLQRHAAQRGRLPPER